MAGTGKRVVVVTGASRGLGLEFVRQLSQDVNNFIIATVRDVEKATQLKPLLGSNVVAVEVEVTDFDSFPSVAQEISHLSGGKVDVLINNAGVMLGTGARPDVGISKSTPAEWDTQYRINVTGLVFLTIALLPLLRQGKEKKVVNLASMLGDLGYARENPGLQFASYAVTKAGVTMANVKFHVEFQSEGFVFLALNPGWVNTELAGSEMGSYAPLQPEESITQCLSFINRATKEHSGQFFTLDGRPEAATN